MRMRRRRKDHRLEKIPEPLRRKSRETPRCSGCGPEEKGVPPRAPNQTRKAGVLAEESEARKAAQ